MDCIKESIHTLIYDTKKDKRRRPKKKSGLLEKINDKILIKH